MATEKILKLKNTPRKKKPKKYIMHNVFTFIYIYIF